MDKQDKDRILSKCIKKGLGLKRIYAKPPAGKYHDSEVTLMGEIKDRRRRGAVVTGRWIQMRMRQLVGNAAAEIATFGSCWLYRFVRRWNLSWRRTTKRKQRSTFIASHGSSAFISNCASFSLTKNNNVVLALWMRDGDGFF